MDGDSEFIVRLMKPGKVILKTTIVIQNGTIYIKEKGKES